jgi:hypothetical protein
VSRTENGQPVPCPVPPLPEDPRVLRAVEEILAAELAAAENRRISLYSAVLRGEAWAVCFFLKTQARDRGYVERQDHHHADEHQVDWEALRRRAVEPRETVEERLDRLLPAPQDQPVGPPIEPDPSEVVDVEAEE